MKNQDSIIELLDTSEVTEILSLNVTICSKSIKKYSFLQLVLIGKTKIIDFTRLTSLMNKFLIVFLILLLSIIISCAPQNGENVLDKKNNADVQLDKNRIIGDWIISGVLLNGEFFHSSYHPKIHFKENNLAILTYPNDEKENYTWRINDNKLELTINEKSKINQYFEYSEYGFEIKNEENIIELKMYISNGKGHILRKYL